MSRSHLAQRLSICFALGLILLLPNVSRATNVAIQHPFSSYTSTPASLSVVSGINIASSGGSFTGILDVKNNDIIIKPTVEDEAHGLANFQAVYSMITQGADQGAYDGAGITSSTVNADATASNAQGGLAIGVMYNDDGSGGNADGSGNPIWGGANSDLGSFDGYTNISQYDTIVKYTFIGDLFLEGAVSVNDWATIFGNLGTTPHNSGPLDQAWQNGDSFYQTSSGTPINVNDWATTFGLLTGQSSYPYTATFASGSGSASIAVPEPTTLSMAAVGLIVGFFAVRRSRRQS